jgi:hypothetical protein
MTPKQIEKLAAAAWAVALAPTAAAEQERVGEMRQLLHSVDPNGVYQPGAPTAGLDAQEDFVSLRDSPRLSRAIGANEAAFHD